MTNFLKPANLPDNYYWQENKEKYDVQFATDCFFKVEHTYYSGQSGTVALAESGDYSSYDRILLLPCYPESVSESQGATWSSNTPLGRSSPMSAYVGTNYRTLSLNFKLHREMCNDENYIDIVLVEMRRAVFPWYVSQGLIPPVATFQFGEFRCKGYVDNLTYNWQKPIVDGHYQVCDVSLSFIDVPEKVFSAQDLGSVPTNPYNVKALR